MTETVKFSQTKANPFGCEIQFDCKYVYSVEDEKRNRIAYVYETNKKNLNILSKNFNTVKIEYEPNGD